MEQSTQDAGIPDSASLQTDFGEVPPELVWTLEHDLPGAAEQAPPESPQRWQESFPMTEAPALEVVDRPFRRWVPMVLTATVAALATLLMVWLLGGFDNGDAAAPSEVAQDGADPATPSAVAAAPSAADVGRKVTPSVATIEVGGVAADGTFAGTAVGSGVVYRNDGYVVTNHHLVNTAPVIRVVVDDGTTFQAELVGSDATTDVAVVRVEATDLTAADIGATDGLVIGDVAIAVGNPLGLAGGASLTVGVLSAFEREIATANSGTLFGMLQTDAPIAEGAAGGALVDGGGRLIGITTEVGSSPSDARGISYAIPVEIVVRIADEIIEHGSVRHAFLGVRLENHFEAAGEGGFRPAGARVASFPEGADSAAAGAGLRIDDIITALDGMPVTTRDDLISALRRYRVNDSVTLAVVRDDQTLTFDVVLGDRPDDL